MNGETVSSFVEIRGVYLKDYRYVPDCRNNYWPVNGGGPYPDANGDGTPDMICDSVGNILTMGTSFSGTNGRIHIEFDMDWMAAGYCGPSSNVCNNNTIAQYASPGISLDVQGFVYWDPGHAGWWELHPFTAWKLSSEPNPDPGQVSTSFAYSPTNPLPGDSVSFSAKAFGGTPPYSFSWNFGDGVTSVLQSPNHAYAQAGIFIVELTATDSAGATASSTDTLIVPSGTSASWNPKVSCTALVVTIEQIRAMRSSNPGVVNHRQLDQPCTVTGREGMEFSVLVQVNGVKRGSLSENDWSTTFATVNGGGPYPNGLQSDTAFNIYSPAYVNSCTSATDLNCYHRVFTEIDRDWKGASYCGPGTMCDNSTLKTQTTTSSTLIDIQGFLHRNPDFAGATWHSLTAWDLHPVTAWKVSDLTSPTWPLGSSLSGSVIRSTSLTLTWTAATDDVGVVDYRVYRDASLVATLGNVLSYDVTALSPDTVYTFRVEAGDESDNWSTTGPSITVRTLPPPDFDLATSTESLTIAVGQSGTATITVSSLYFFSGDVGFSAEVASVDTAASLSPSYPTAEFDPASLFIAPDGTGTSVLTVSASLLTLPGTYTVTVTAVSGSISHSVTITVTVVLLELP